MIKTHKIGNYTFEFFNYLILTLFLLICIYPFYYIFIFSLSDPYEVQKGITLSPAGFTLNNYKFVLGLTKIGNAAIVSTVRTILGTLVNVLCCTFFAFLVSRKELPMRKFIYRYMVITMYFSAGIIPYYLTMRMLHLNNNFLIYIIPGALNAFYVILAKTYFEELPSELEESAKIDGAGYLTIFFRIIFPLSTPIIATIAIFSAVMHWNSWFDNYLFVQTEGLKTLQLLLYEYLNESNSLAAAAMKGGNSVTALREVKTTPQAIRMTITMVATLPILLVYPYMQKHFTKGIMLGAVKG